MSKVLVKAKFPFEGVSMKLSLFNYIDENVNVVYSPALDLYGYGNDETEARSSFEVVLQEYVRYTIEHKTLEKDLKKIGWKIDLKHHLLSNPDVSVMLQKNDSFKEIFNNKAFKKFDLQIPIALA